MNDIFLLYIFKISCEGLQNGSSFPTLSLVDYGKNAQAREPLINRSILPLEWQQQEGVTDFRWKTASQALCIQSTYDL